ncbi:MAG TPA: hypothetical protein G4O08_07755 [Anaerolineae bacterium]|nr:hypothetical protein [Anaerolineae bacterium]
MHTQKRWLIGINVLGGAAVIGSYIQGILTHEDAGTVLWGGVPPSIQSLSTAWMPVAVLGYFAFTGYLLFALDADQARIGNRFGYRLFHWIYLGILVPSALWMPLTFGMIEQPSSVLWWAITVVLILVGLVSLGLLAALLALKVPRKGWTYWLAVIGTVGFSVQTVIMDAVLWVVYFRI